MPLRSAKIQDKPLPYAKEIAAFQAQDRANPPAKGQILFIGSSSFTRWTDVQSYFPSHPILNRAFGGSQLPDVIARVDDVVFPYQPKQVVIYCGENDFAADSKLEAPEVFERFKTLYKLIRGRLPNVPVVYVSMKPSPSRWNMRLKFIAANRKISDYLSHQKAAAFIDVWPVMLGADGQPKPEIYVGDRLHMNADGYKLWQPLIEAQLVK